MERPHVTISDRGRLALFACAAVGFFAFVAVLDAAVGTERVSFNKG